MRVTAARPIKKTHVAAYWAGPLGFHQSQKSGVPAEWKKVMDMADMPISPPPLSPLIVGMGMVMAAVSAEFVDMSMDSMTDIPAVPELF
ncbi:hypothetical protein NEMBOFW57_010382 [Staphylotrichum longicolle]|uniref:Uncharacterized protein n=1 Tax=Staphylotrichum longicolle TaxID=669026 RepID=A0AAD4EMQ5_9PEZI|nr:hypothetical protein NEMBOFW57_010382 [Staphylotrichum longicolle]